MTASDRRTPPYGTLLIHAREIVGAHRRLDLELRAYDRGAAFRLTLPPQPGLDTVRIAGERTRLNFPRALDCLAVRHEKFVNSHEGDYAPVRADALRAGSLYDLPFTCMTGRGGETLAITESGIEKFAAAYLTGQPGRAGVVDQADPATGQRRARGRGTDAARGAEHAMAGGAGGGPARADDRQYAGR